MRKLFLIAALAVPAPAVADVWQGTLVDPAYLRTIHDETPTLPRGLAPHERGVALPDALRVPFAPPPGPVRAQAEYEPNDGLLVRWNSQTALITQMAVAVTTLTADARMYVVVTGASQQSSASATLSGAGVDMSRVVFVTQPCSSGCSVWMRDYGPRFVDDAGARGAIDHVYNRPRPVDDAFPGVWATTTGEAKYDIPLTHGGGNFHLFANRRAFMTQLIVNENPGVTAQQIRDYYTAYQGLDVEIVPAFPSSFDSTQHIDMWVYPVDDDEIIVGEYPAAAGGGVPKQVSDDFAAARASDGYTVYRTPGWSSGGTHFTYANAIVLNEIVMVCRFNNAQTPSGTGAENTQAANTFAAAFQDKTIVPVDCSGIIGLAGAIHCIVMHVPRMSVPLLIDGFE
ncbi:MAG TPA: agmatine deiminase family protein [Xanthomonadales bacterium]|nr:agmatine deiminase family protein [Xanthomonadales bacterium]